MRATRNMRAGPPKTFGFTLFELMLTLAVAAILAAVAIPNMRDFIRNNRLTAAANDLLRSTQRARTEAVKRQENVVVCASDDPAAETPACSYDAFKGWIMFVDPNNNWDYDDGEALLERHDLVDSSVTVINNHDAIVSYRSSGFANSAGAHTPSTEVVICDARGNTSIGDNSTARAVRITNSGRARTTKLHTEVADAITAIGGTCP